jgi:hypothetical protein
MNGMAADAWPYVIAAYVVTWAVILGYTVRLVRMTRDQKASRSQTGSQP